MSPGWSPDSWAAEWLETMWCGFQVGAGDVALNGFLSQCGSGEPCSVSTEWATPLQIGELVIVQDDTQGEIIELDMSRDLFTHCVRTLDGVTRWYAEAKVKRLKAKAVESQRLRSEIAAAAGAAKEQEFSAPQSPGVTPRRQGKFAARENSARSRKVGNVVTAISNPSSPLCCGEAASPQRNESLQSEDPTQAAARVEAAVQELGVENTVSDFIAMPILTATRAVMAASPRVSREDTEYGLVAVESAQRAARVEAAFGELPLDTHDTVADECAVVRPAAVTVTQGWPDFSDAFPQLAQVQTSDDLHRGISGAHDDGIFNDVWRLSGEDRFKTTSSDLLDLHFGDQGLSLVGIPEPHEVPWLVSPPHSPVRLE